jgi:DNA-directed RNA polymerase sigma subunit (sigma70/sigma32)
MAAFEDALAGTRQVRLAPNVVTLLNRIRQINKTFMQRMWREPRVDELARELGVDVATAEKLQVTALTPLSFDAQLYGGEEEGPASSLEDFMVNKLPGPDEVAMAKQATERTAKALEVLNPKELHVLQLRYAARTDYTLAAVGKELGITAERVRQIEEKALQKLRAYSPEADAFKEMLGTIVGDLLPPCQ